MGGRLYVYQMVIFNGLLKEVFNMECLQCNKPAVEKGETYKGIKIRECEDGHRTALYIETYNLSEKAA